MAAFPNGQVVIVTGSQKAGAFALSAGVRVVRLPRADKSSDGTYASGETGMSREAVIALRSRIICNTARALSPHLFIADKEPLGLLGELEETLDVLKAMGTRLVLGLRDVLDETDMLRSEWDKKGITGQIAELYETFWIYGPKGFHDPLSGMDLPRSIEANTHFLGFIATPNLKLQPPPRARLPQDYILVTSGGGGDGVELTTAVIAAYEADPSIANPPLFLLGPFMDPDEATRLRKRAEKIAGSVVLDFDSEPETLIANAAGIVAMCGYNTFCEVVGHDRPGLFIPREKPRLEQYIRAGKASELGLCSMMRTKDARAKPLELAEKLKGLPYQKRPSQCDYPVNLYGLENLKGCAAQELARWTAGETVNHAWN